jgi:hypothetical protein
VFEETEPRWLYPSGMICRMHTETLDARMAQRYAPPKKVVKPGPTTSDLVDPGQIRRIPG